MRKIPLIVAIEGNYLDAVKLLLAAGVNPNNPQEQLCASHLIFPLQVAAEKGFTQIARMLIVAGAEINVSYRYTRTPLCIAAEHGHYEMVRLLVENGADINKTHESWKWSALSLATYAKHWDIAKFLLSKRADVNSGDEQAGYPLKYAIKAGNEEMVTLLLDAGARTDVRVNNGWCESELKDNFHTYCPKSKYEAIKTILDRYN